MRRLLAGVALLPRWITIRKHELLHVVVDDDEVGTSNRFEMARTEAAIVVTTIVVFSSEHLSTANVTGFLFNVAASL